MSDIEKQIASTHNMDKQQAKVQIRIILVIIIIFFFVAICIHNDMRLREL